MFDVHGVSGWFCGVVLLLVTGIVQANTVAYWRFEGTNFLSDTTGQHMLSNNGGVEQVASPFRNPVPQTESVNTNAASFDGTSYLMAADDDAFTSTQFTLEAFFSPATIGSATRVIAGHFGSDGDYANQRSYALVMLNTGQLRIYISPNGGIPAQYIGPVLTAGSHYYAAAAVDVLDAGSSAITLYVQDLNTSTLQVIHYAKSQAVTGPTSYTIIHNSSAPFTIGATGQGGALWEGPIDEVRLSNVKLAQENLLISEPLPPPPPPGETPTWQAFRTARFGADVTSEANIFADPDGDGIINLFEHAFGGDPHEAGTAHLPIWDFANVPNELKVSYLKAADDIDYVAQWRSELLSASWSSAEFSEEKPEPNGELFSRTLVFDEPQPRVYARKMPEPLAGKSSAELPKETQDTENKWFSRTLAFDAPPPRVFARLGIGLQDRPNQASFPQAGGFRGIWFDLGQASEYGSKYSGGLGTYTANHVPMAHYVPEVNRTYFTWGGTTEADEKRLLILVSYFDHNTGLAARPVVVMDKTPVNDPHDNGSMSIDEEGYIWIFVSGRNISRLGRIYRSKVPYGIRDWIVIGDSEFTYPQPWWFDGKGFFHTYTRYTAGRELYFQTSRNGTAWSAERKLAGIGGHYQTSDQVGDRILTSFNRHPNGSVDRRTDLYYMETADMGETWTTADGTVLTIPLSTADNPARIKNYSASDDLVYICDMTADADGRPVILYITSKHHQPGPNANPRFWKVARWTGTEWLFHEIATALHNYDMGSIYIEEDGTWRVIAPIGAGPQHWGTGGEMEVWTSADQGASWVKQRAVTRDSARNHSYARRPRNAHPDFYAYWADGDADTFSESHLWFTNKAGDKLWHLPYDMTNDYAAPSLVVPD